MTEGAGVDGSLTFLDVLVKALERAGDYNRDDQVAPAAVLWTDKERQWEPLLPVLRERLPLLTLGVYSPEDRTGSAYWLRCVIARTLPEHALPPDETPIIYLPGVSRQELRAVEDCPRELQPLAELQYRGIFWSHQNGRDWTIAGFLQNANGGLGIQVGLDGATKDAMQKALTRLVEQPVEALRREAPLKAAFFYNLLNPDEVRSLLLWLNDPDGYRRSCSEEEWHAHVATSVAKYGFHPEQDGEVTAARLLGERQGHWDFVWRRFAESPRSYPHIPELLRRARPQRTLGLFDHRGSWPQDNEGSEQALRDKLLQLEGRSAPEAREVVHSLEQEHGQRRQWVWADLGQSPLAQALEHLSALAKSATRALVGATLEEIAAAYVEWGWQVDAEALSALGAVEQPEDAKAVKVSATALYRPWMEESANAWQRAAHEGYPDPDPFGAEEGACLLFSDGLRLDLGHQLVAELERRGLQAHLEWRLAAVPPVTSTAKPALTLAADSLVGGVGFDLAVPDGAARVDAERLRSLLRSRGYQTLAGDDLGDPQGRVWTELGDIDSFGHEHGWKVAHQVPREIRDIAARVQGLLDHGWKEVTVITDHGWLLLPGGLPKTELPEHLTEIRKGRCARLKQTATTNQLSLSWHWDRSVRVAFAPGISCYEAGKEWEHGGMSPQECVVPVLHITPPAQPKADVSIAVVVWRGLRCNVTLSGSFKGTTVDIRTKAADPSTSIAENAKPPRTDGTVSLVVPDDSHEGQAALVVVLGPGGRVLSQAHTTIGGD